MKRSTMYKFILCVLLVLASGCVRQATSVPLYGNGAKARTTSVRPKKFVTQSAHQPAWENRHDLRVVSHETPDFADPISDPASIENKIKRGYLEVLALSFDNLPMDGPYAERSYAYLRHMKGANIRALEVPGRKLNYFPPEPVYFNRSQWMRDAINSEIELSLRAKAQGDQAAAAYWHNEAVKNVTHDGFPASTVDQMINDYANSQR